MKKSPFGLIVMAGLLAGWRGDPDANFVHMHVTGAATDSVRAIWRPHAGVIGTTVRDQQAAVGRMRAVPNFADSARRWRDPDVRDTIVGSLPIDFVVDMNSGPVVVEALGDGSITIEAQLTGRAFAEKASGRQLTVSADGTRVRIK